MSEVGCTVSLKPSVSGRSHLCAACGQPLPRWRPYGDALLLQALPASRLAPATERPPLSRDAGACGAVRLVPEPSSARAAPRSPLLLQALPAGVLAVRDRRWRGKRHVARCGRGPIRRPPRAGRAALGRGQDSPRDRRAARLEPSSIRSGVSKLGKLGYSLPHCGAVTLAGLFAKPGNTRKSGRERDTGARMK
jgi:hypothetical protein